MNEPDPHTPEQRRSPMGSVLGRVVTLGALVAAVIFVLAGTASHRQPTGVHQVTQHISGRLLSAPTPGCQIDPLHVSYTATYQRPGGPFIVPQATVNRLDSACFGATLTVVLEDRSGHAIASDTGSAVVTNQTTSVSISPAPPASQVGQVSLALSNLVSNGNVTISSGQNATYTGLTVNGNVTIASGGTFNCNYCTVNGMVSSAGSLTLANTRVSKDLQTSAGSLTVGVGSAVGGNLQALGGGPVNLSSATVWGNLQLQNLTSSSLGTVCSMAAAGNFTVQSNSEPLKLGGSTGCLGNQTGGNLQVQNNTAVMTIGAGNALPGGPASMGNSASSNIQVQNNTGSSTSSIGGNYAGGNCTLSGNSPVVHVSGINSAGHSNKCTVAG